MKKILLIINLVFLISTTYAKVDPPNYDFSLDALEPFYPGKSVKDLEKNKIKYEKSMEIDGKVIFKSYIAHIRYKFPLYFEAEEDTIVSFYAKLPTYFLHDVFHQSLINRIGKQDKYLKKEEHAVYFWKNKNKMTHVYEGACTIICFPIYYSVMKPELYQDQSSLLHVMSKK